MRYFVLAFFVFATPAYAQQPQLSAPEIMLQIDGILHGWAQAIPQLQKLHAEDQKQIADLQKQLVDLKAKQKPEKPEKPVK